MTFHPEVLLITLNLIKIMRILIFLAEGFEEIEAIAPVDIFRRAGLNVSTVSITENKEVIGAHGIKVLADNLFSSIEFSENDFLFLPGGMPGTKNLEEHEGLKQLIKQQFDLNKPMAAICAAPSILGKMGLLEGKEAVCYPGFENFLTGATLSEHKMVKSGQIYTAKAAGVAIPYALMLVEELIGKEEANKIANSIYF
jgi:4-methyl-5(b-hydroxyethyl)-thiazole monophosphate biosynthesis